MKRQNQAFKAQAIIPGRGSSNAKTDRVVGRRKFMWNMRELTLTPHEGNKDNQCNLQFVNFQIYNLHNLYSYKAGQHGVIQLFIYRFNICNS